MKLFLLKILTAFILQDNAMLLRLELLNEQLVFHDLSYVLKHRQDMFFFFSPNKTLRAIVRLFFSKFLQWSFSDGYFFLFFSYFLIKALIFVIISGYFPISLWFHATVIAYRKQFIAFLLIGFIATFFYPIRRIYIWSAMFKIYFMASII